MSTAYHAGGRRAALDSMDLGLRSTSPSEVATQLRSLARDFESRHETMLHKAFDLAETGEDSNVILSDAAYYAGARDMALALAEQHAAAADRRPVQRRRATGGHLEAAA